MITIVLKDEREAQILKGLLVQLMMNKEIGNPQQIVDNAQNSLFFMQKIEEQIENCNKQTNNTTN